jgi:hypothetical protein
MSEVSKVISEVNEVIEKYHAFSDACRRILPKIKEDLIIDVIRQTEAEPSRVPMFNIEVVTKPGTDPQAAREYIIQKTGMAPEIFDGGTHYVTTQKLSLQMLKEISDSDDVVSVFVTNI